MPTSGQFFPYQNFLTPNPTEFFRDNILRFVPEMYKTGEFDGTEDFFNVIVAPLLDEMYQRGIDLPQLANIDRCPPGFLQLLAGNINVLTIEDSFDETQTISLRRRELGKMVDIFKIRGTSNSFERILKYLGALGHGVYIPSDDLNILDITPFPGPIPGDMNDVGESLAPIRYDISGLCNGVLNPDGNLVGTKVQYTIPVTVVRSNVSLIWNGKKMPLGPNIFASDQATDFSYQFNKSTGILLTNFIPYAGDSLIAQVDGDPRYLRTFKFADARYYRQGTTDVWSDVDPSLKFAALNDRRPAGTLLFLTWMTSKYSLKFFAPPAIDLTRNGYPGVLPPNELSTYDASQPSAADPWFVTGQVVFSVVAETALGHLTVSTSVTFTISGVQTSGEVGAADGVYGFSITGVSSTSHAGTLDATGTADVSSPSVHTTTHLGSIGSGVPLDVPVTGVQAAGQLGSISVVITP